MPHCTLGPPPIPPFFIQKTLHYLSQLDQYALSIGGEDFNIGHFYPRGMSYDWLSKNLYWKDLYYDVIAVLKLDGDFTVETVVNDNAKSFSNIQVAPLAG